MPRIELINVTKRWGKFVGVDHLNMVIEDREFITLLGPSGCGKTTTLRMIAGLETPTEGKIIIGDRVVFDSETGINLSPAKRDVGFLFQNYALWPHMTVYKNIRFGLENQKVESDVLDKDGNPVLGPDEDKIEGLKNLIANEKDQEKLKELKEKLAEAKAEKVVPVKKYRHYTKQEMEDRIDEVLKMLKIEEFRNRYPAELSGGQQQRVAIARTLAPKPKVLFMDEPLSNLDAKLRGEMRTELKRLHSDTNSTFVYVTHDQLEAMTLATRVCLINKGILQQYDPPLTVYSNPANLFVADFIGNPTMNFIDGMAERVDEKTVKLEIHGVKAIFHAKEAFKLSCEEEQPVEEQQPQEAQPQEEQPVDEGPKPNVVIGIRPEFLPIRDAGKVKGSVYSTLPAGMETTIKIDLNGALLSSVVFGSIDYMIDQEIHFDIDGSGIILFDAKTTNAVAIGSVEVK